MLDDIIQGTSEVFHQRHSLGDVAVKGNHFFQDAQITCFFNISTGSCDEPERIVIEATADIGITFFSQRLILVISTAVLELSGGDINDTLPCTIRDQMHESEQILTGIAEAHAAPDTGFIIGSGA